MAENNIAMQDAVGSASGLLLNGVEATAQQVYDAFMAGPVRLQMKIGGRVYVPSSIYWENSDGRWTNPKAVTYVEVYCVKVNNDGSVTGTTYSIGTKYNRP